MANHKRCPKAFIDISMPGSGKDHFLSQFHASVNALTSRGTDIENEGALRRHS